MINHPKSAEFISWNALGTSFIVTNVGEFSRSILGAHFKHNNVRLFRLYYIGPSSDSDSYIFCIELTAYYVFFLGSWFFQCF